MNLSELLGEDSILLDFQAKDKVDAIDRLLERLKAVQRLKKGQLAAARKALIARENIASTGLGNGIALPHATVDGFDGAVAALAISPLGVPFQAMDGKPVHIIILIVIPRRHQQSHVRTLAAVARLLNYEETRQALVAAKTPGAVLRIIQAEEGQETTN